MSFIRNLIELLKFEGLTGESDTIYTHIPVNGPKLDRKCRNMCVQ